MTANMTANIGVGERTLEDPWTLCAITLAGYQHRPPQWAVMFHAVLGARCALVSERGSGGGE
jgi:hypothetical protein